MDFLYLKIINNCFIVLAVGAVIGFFSGMFFIISVTPPALSDVIADKITELYNKKQQDCSAYLIKRAKSISKNMSKDNAECNNNHVVKENININLAQVDKIFQSIEHEADQPEHDVHDYCCSGCNHTLIECCEVDKLDIVQVINKVIARK